MKLQLVPLIIPLLVYVASCSPLEDIDTFAIDVTTISAIEVEEDSTSATPTAAPPQQVIKNVQQCSTTKGKMGHCTTVGDCYTLLITENGTVPFQNRILVEMLIESSGFCGGEMEARSDLTPSVLEQILRSEVLLCCPETPQTLPSSFTLDTIDTAADVYDEVFKKRSCGYTSKEMMMKEAPVVSDVEECEHRKNCSRIVKGRKTKVGEYPWVVAMMNRNKQFCGASLINENTVLTAAHCVQHMTAADVRNLRLQIGDWDIYKTGDVKHESRGAKAVKYHKGFSMKHLNHDIALVILDRPVQFTDTIRAVCLHTGTPNVEDGKTRADVAGWGALSEGGSQPSDMRAVTVRVLTHSQCVKRYSGTANKIGAGMFCAGADKGEDSCQGDSGGPATVDSKDQAKQIGVRKEFWNLSVVSWGIGCGRYPGVYTAVWKYLNWINTNMG